MIIGLITYFKVIEHRLLTISYVRSLNKIRKWYEDNSITKIEKYLFFKADHKKPKYYDKYKHFYWEAFGISIINGILLTILLVNIINAGLQLSYIFNFWIFLVMTLIAALIVRLQLYYYSKRANTEDGKER